MLLKPFVINSHGRIVFPGNFFPELDFSVFKTLKQFAAVIRRDFGEKAFTDVEIAGRCTRVNTRTGMSSAVTWC
jgi:3-oxoacyl-[acyl-carrier-protein] synthase III